MDWEKEAMYREFVEKMEEKFEDLPKDEKLFLANYRQNEDIKGLLQEIRSLIR